MKYLKLFEQYDNEQEIKEFCISHEIYNYTINSDGSVDVDGSVDISNLGLSFIPIKFNNVHGYFNCSENRLTSLENSPKFCGGYFDCSENYISSLEHCPLEVNGSFSCGRNDRLKSIEFISKKITGNIYLNSLPILDLVGFQSEGFQGLSLLNCEKLTSLEGCPEYINGKLDLAQTNLYNFDNFPNFAEGRLNLRLSKIFSMFGNRSDLIEAFNDYNIIKSPIDNKSKPRLKLKNLNNFLVDFGFEKVNVEDVESIYEIK